MRIRRFLSHIPIPAAAALSLVVTIAVSLIVDTPSAPFGVSAAIPPVRESSSSGARQEVRGRVAENLARLPLSFEPNRGQTDSRVKYMARGRGYTLFLTGDEAVLTLRRHSASSRQSSVANGQSPRTVDNAPRTDDSPSVLRMSLVGANPTARLAGLDELPGKSNYFIGNDPAKWRTNVPQFRKVVRRQVYPGIDLVYYGRQRELEYDFNVAPGADPGDIRFNIQGAENLRIDSTGDLIVSVPGGELRMHKPDVYQMVGQTRQPVGGSYRLASLHEVALQISAYDPSKALIIDPVLSYSTYLGGNNIDVAKGIAVGSDGTAFIVGETDSGDFPTAHALQPNQGGGVDFPDDIFVSKISSDGSTLIYSTYLGGEAREYAGGITVDSFGSAYITGTTLSVDYPTTQNGFQPAGGTDGQLDKVNDRYFTDAVVTKLNPAGSALAYSSFYTSSTVTPSHEQGFAIAVDANGDAFVTGSTTINDSAFVIGVDATGSALLYELFLDGNGNDQGFGIASDRNGVATVTGFTNSTNFPVTGNALQAAFGGAADGFVARISAAGVPTYVSYLGGTGADQGNAVTLDATGIAYVAGVTNTTAANLSFAIPGAPYQSDCTLNASLNCEGDAFVAKMDLTQAGAASLLYFTYLGGSNAETGAGIAVDSANSAYVTGFTNSPDFPVFGGAFQSNYGGGNTDAFVTKLDAGATALVYSSYLGGSNAEEGKGIAVDVNANAYVAGQTCSSDFPTARPLQATQAGNCDAFVAKVRVGPDIHLSASSLSFGAQAVGTTSIAQTVTVTSIGDSNLDIASVGISGNFQIQSDSCTGASLAVDQICTISVTFTPTSFGPKTGTLTLTDNVAPLTHTVSLSGSGTNISLTPTELFFGDQGVGSTSGPQTITVTNTGTGAITIYGIDTGGDFAQNNTCTNSLASGASCIITVTFTPTVSGIITGQVTVTDDDPTSPQVIVVSGHGTAPVAAVAPTNLAFGDQGATAAPQIVTLSNNGNAPLSITSISVSGAFSQTSTCGGTLVAGASCQISVSFVPTAPGTASGQVSIADNAAGSPQVVALSGNAVVPVASLSATSLTFGEQPVNSTSQEETLILTNTGSTTLNIASAAVSGVNSGDFALTNNCPAAVLAGGNCTMTVTFSPTAAGTRLAGVTITDDAPGSPQTIGLSGAGVLAPWVTLAPASLTFADLPVGTTSSAQAVTLTNTGSAELLISSIGTTGDFTKSDQCGSSLAAGANCTINITFKPTAVGNRYGSLTVADNAADSPQTVLLAGNGLPAPTVSLSPPSLTFGDQPINSTSNPQTVTLTNTGGAQLDITSVAITGANGGDFAISFNTCSGTFSPGTSCTISVIFSPTVDGNRTASITITDNALDSPQSVSLAGTGALLPGVSLDPASLTFGSQSVGTSSQPQSVTLTNTGGGTLIITGLAIAGTNASDFVQNNTCGASLAPGLTCTISVIFTPSETGNRLATLSITDNAPGSPHNVALFGGGSGGVGDYALTVDPSTQAVFAGSTATYNLTITPVAGYSAKINLACTGAPRGTTCTVDPSSVAPGGDAAVFATVAVQTTARTLAPPVSGPSGFPPHYMLRWLTWAMLLFMLTSLALARRRYARLVLGLALFTVMLWTACGGGGTTVGVPRGTPAGTSTLTITGTSGGLTRTTTVTLTVQ
jgi:hypothetical protein